MTDRDFRLKVDPDGTLWLDVTAKPEREAGAILRLAAGVDPDDPYTEVSLSGRDLAEIHRLVDVSDVSDGHREAKRTTGNHDPPADQETVIESLKELRDSFPEESYEYADVSQTIEYLRHYEYHHD